MIEALGYIVSMIFYWLILFCVAFLMLYILAVTAYGIISIVKKIRGIK